MGTKDNMVVHNITKKFLMLSRIKKQAIIALSDSVLLIAAAWIAFSLRFDEFYIPSNEMFWFLFAPIPFIAVPIFIFLGLYRAIIRYIGFRALWAVVQAVSLYAIGWGILSLFVQTDESLRSVVIINLIAALLLIGGTRMIARWWVAGTLLHNQRGLLTKKRVAIYGAGAAGIQLATALSYSNEYKPVCFIDDKSELHNAYVNSLRVYPFNRLSILIEQMNIDEVLLAIPTASRSRRNYIIQSLDKHPVHVRTLPGMAEVAAGQVKIEDIKEVDIEDLLGRDSVPPYPDLLNANIHNKVVMVSGAGGSIGSELCRQILAQKPKCLILFELNEYALYSIESELSMLDKCDDSDYCKVIPVLGSVLDQSRFEEVCHSFDVNTIYHAAAYKHVPLVEKNPVEAIRNNIIGTLTAAKAAMATGVETFVLISTDKAVRPTNVMGATKRFAELIMQALATQRCDTRFCMVRFGNVLGSSGSVVPVFRNQIKNDGPVTVTHPEIIRYFMTIPEAAQLVIQAGGMAVGGDVFVLDMGDPVKINELAHKMIRLSGLEVKDEANPDGDIAIEYTGLRPGEKLYEELLIGNNPIGTKHPRIFKAIEESIAWEDLKVYIDALEDGISASNCEVLLTLLLNVVSDYNPQGVLEDFVWKEKRTGNDMDHVVELKNFRKNTPFNDVKAKKIKKPS